MFDAFNVFNINTITEFDDDNMSVEGFYQPTEIIPPRVFRVGTRITF